MRPIPADSLGHAHGLLRAIDKRGRLRTDEFVTEFSLDELFPPDLENALGRMRHFISFARAAGLVKEDRGVVELTEVGRRYIRSGEPDEPFAVGPQQAEWLRRQLREKHMTDSIFHGLAIGLSLLASTPRGTRVATMDFGRSMAYLGRAGWDNENTLQIQGERHLILLQDMEMIDAEHVLTPTGELVRGELTLPVHMSLPDIAAQLNPGGAEAVRAAAEAEFAEPAPPPPVVEQAAPADEEEEEDDDDNGYHTVGSFGSVPPSTEGDPEEPRPPIVPRAASQTYPDDAPPPMASGDPLTDAPSLSSGDPLASSAPPPSSAPPSGDDPLAAEPPVVYPPPIEPTDARTVVTPGPGSTPPLVEPAAPSPAEPEAAPVAPPQQPAPVSPPPVESSPAEPPATAPAQPEPVSVAPPQQPAPVSPVPAESAPAAPPADATPVVPPAQPAPAPVTPPAAAPAQPEAISVAPPQQPVPVSPAPAESAPAAPPAVPPVQAEPASVAPPQQPAPAESSPAAPPVQSAPASVAPPAPVVPAPGPTPVAAPRPAASGVFVEAWAIRAAAEEAGLRLSDGVYANVAAALNAGKHLVLTGAPGSGKTSLALAVTRAAAQAGHAKGATVVTGAPAQRLVTEAAALGRWLIADELDQADADATLKPLSTLLGGVPVTLDGDEAEPAPGWRIVATWNGTPPRGANVLRRFAAIDVARPPMNELKALLHQTDPQASEAVEILLALGAPLGAGVLIEAANHIRARQAAVPTDASTLADEAVAAYIAPLIEL
jgi:hypothetical protein